MQVPPEFIGQARSLRSHRGRRTRSRARSDATSQKLSSLLGNPLDYSASSRKRHGAHCGEDVRTEVEMVVVRWQAEDGYGLEHAEITVRPSGIEAESVVIGDRFGPYGARYRLLCAADWSVRSVEINVVGAGTLRLTSDGAGHWKDAAGVSLGELQGCLDVDISATPLTNTLPIRRLQLASAERREIRVVYIQVPSLVPALAMQAYTCLVSNERYRYEGLFDRFETELVVDAEGLVIDYPTLFRRVR
jgi:uncharacterized protein